MEGQVTATPETAAPAVEAPKGTTARLFPETVVAEAKPEPIKETKQPEAKTETPAPSQDYLDFEASKTKKVKVKIDGVESEVPFEELHRSYQTDRSLTQKAQRLAEDRRRFEEQLKASKSAQNPNDPKLVEDKADPLYEELIAPHMRSVLAELAATKKELAELRPTIVPLQMEQRLEADDANFKKLGFTGFKEAVKSGNLRKLALELTEKAPGESETDHALRAQQEWDTEMGIHKLFTVLKTREAMAAKPAEQPAPAPKAKEEKPAPKVPDVEGGSGGPSGANEGNAELREAFKAAKASKGNSEAWQKYFEVRDKLEMTAA